MSDYYIEGHIEKIFTHKFLEYESSNIKDILAKQIELKKKNNKKFLGFALEFPDLNNS